MPRPADPSRAVAPARGCLDQLCAR